MKIKDIILRLFVAILLLFDGSNGYGKDVQDEFRVKRVVVDSLSNIYALWQEDNNPQQATLFYTSTGDLIVKKAYLLISFSDRLGPYLPRLTIDQIANGVHKYSKWYLYPMSWSLFNDAVYPVYFFPALEPMMPSYPSRAFGIAKYRLQEMENYKKPRNINYWLVNNIGIDTRYIEKAGKAQKNVCYDFHLIDEENSVFAIKKDGIMTTWILSNRKWDGKAKEKISWEGCFSLAVVSGNLMLISSEGLVGKLGNITDNGFEKLNLNMRLSENIAPNSHITWLISSLKEGTVHAVFDNDEIYSIKPNGLELEDEENKDPIRKIMGRLLEASGPITNH